MSKKRFHCLIFFPSLRAIASVVSQHNIDKLTQIHSQIVSRQRLRQAPGALPLHAARVADAALVRHGGRVPLAALGHRAVLPGGGDLRAGHDRAGRGARGQHPVEVVLPRGVHDGVQLEAVVRGALHAEQRDHLRRGDRAAEREHGEPGAGGRRARGAAARPRRLGPQPHPDPHHVRRQAGRGPGRAVRLRGLRERPGRRAVHLRRLLWPPRVERQRQPAEPVDC